MRARFTCVGDLRRHCEERSDEAIQFCKVDCFASLAMTAKGQRRGWPGQPGHDGCGCCKAPGLGLTFSHLEYNPISAFASFALMTRGERETLPPPETGLVERREALRSDGRPRKPFVAERARLARRIRNPFSSGHADEPLAKVRHKGASQALWRLPALHCSQRAGWKRDRVVRALTSSG